MSDNVDRSLQDRFLATRAEKPSHSSGGGGDHMEPRIARLEAGMEYLTREISELRTDVRELRSDISTARMDAKTDFQLVFGALITVALGLAALMAKGFGWL